MDALTHLQILLYRIVASLPLLFVFGLGAAIGSFLNVVIYRLPQDLSLIHPPSRCPHCSHRLGPSENIPIWGWIRLKGRCKSCRASISPRYPLVELATALVFVLIVAIAGWSWTAVGYGVLFSWLLALALIDFDTQTLPNPLTQSGLLLGLGFQAILGFLESQGAIAGTIQGLMGGVIGAVLGIWLLGTIGLLGSVALGKAAMGGGDAKLAAMMGAWLGWKLLLLSLFLAALGGAVVGSIGIWIGLLQRQQRIPFGPFLALGAAMSALWGGGLIALYQSFFWTTT